MRRYSTEIHIPADRRVTLQLPDDLPEGRAFVIVQVAESAGDTWAPHDDEDRHDIEWWDEFDEVVEDLVG